MTTLRIRGIPSTTTKHDLSKALKVHSDCVSLTRTDPTATASTTTKTATAAAADGDGGQTATVTFKTHRAANKFRSHAQRRWPKCLGRRPRIDTDFLGLTVLASSAADDVDVVAVHGLNGHAFDTWSADDRMWLRDFLPASLPPGVRVLTYGYNSNVFDRLSTTTIPEFALGLLAALATLRGARHRSRPLIFICHSLGGIVVKLALNMARTDGRFAALSAATRGIVFLATPHRGCATASRALRGAMGLAARATLGLGTGLGLALRRDLLVALRLDSRQLADIDADFRLHHARLHTVGFYETRKTRIASLTGLLDRVIVERSSAAPTTTTATAIAATTTTAMAAAAAAAGTTQHFPVERDHRDICKFACRHEDDYKAVSTQLSILVARARAPTSRRSAVRRVVVKAALHMPQQLGAMLRLGTGENLVLARYGEAWTV